MPHPVITQNHIDKSLTYSQYKKLVSKLLTENKTTGKDTPPEYLHFTGLNIQRSERIEKTIDLEPELINILQSLAEPWYWLVITEGWCGDSSQILPVLAKMADASPTIELCILLRDENPEIMDAYLTDGTRSIPKLICLKQDFTELGNWGPRPQPAQNMLHAHINNKQETKVEFQRKLHTWYAMDKSKTLQHEFLKLIGEWQRKS